MRPAERRERIRQMRLAAGGATAGRQRLLDATAPEDRSEAAAAYDAALSLAAQDPTSPAMLATARRNLERCLLAAELVKRPGAYRIDQLLARLSVGTLSDGQRAVVDAARAIVNSSITDTDVQEEADRLHRERRAYVALRYGADEEAP